MDSPFLQLSTEIRIIIYDFIFQDVVFADTCMYDHELHGSFSIRHSGYLGLRVQETFQLPGDDNSSTFDADTINTDRNLLGILQTCRFIRAEASPVLFEHLTIILRGAAFSGVRLGITKSLLKGTRILECSDTRARQLKFDELPNLEVLIIVLGESFSSLRMLRKASNYVKHDWVSFLRDRCPVATSNDGIDNLISIGKNKERGFPIFVGFWNRGSRSLTYRCRRRYFLWDVDKNEPVQQDDIIMRRIDFLRSLML